MLSDLIEFCRIVSKELLPTHDNTIQYNTLYSQTFFTKVSRTAYGCLKESGLPLQLSPKFKLCHQMTPQGQNLDLAFIMYISTIELY